MTGNTKLSVRAVKRRTNKPRETKRTFVPSIHRAESRIAKFYMFTYRMGNGRRPLTFHNGKYNYGPQRCPESSCPRGKKCNFAHGAFEAFFHPLRYKTQRCSKGEECNLGEACARAHSNEELRVLSRILGRNWRLCNPVSAEELAELEEKKEKKRTRNTRVVIRGTVSNTPSKAGSVKARQAPSRTATPMSQSTTTVAASRSEMSSVASFASPSPALHDMTMKTDEMSEDVEEDAKQEMEIAVTAKDESSQRQQSEFEWWINKALGGCARDYIAKFENCNLDDLSLLWNLYEERPETLVEDVLVGVIGMSDDRDRNEFVAGLCEYKSPRDVRGWLERVVSLPQYLGLFKEYESVQDLCYLGFDGDDLTEMGISSVGHRTKILYYLRRLEQEGGEEHAEC